MGWIIWSSLLQIQRTLVEQKPQLQMIQLQIWHYLLQLLLLFFFHDILLIFSRLMSRRSFLSCSSVLPSTLACCSHHCLSGYLCGHCLNCCCCDHYLSCCCWPSLWLHHQSTQPQFFQIFFTPFSFPRHTAHILHGRQAENLSFLAVCSA